MCCNNDASVTYSTRAPHNHADVIALIKKGLEFGISGNYIRAIKYFDKALSIDPENFVALISKGESLYDLGNYTQAIQYYDKALAIDPTNVDALTNKGTALNMIVT